MILWSPMAAMRRGSTTSLSNTVARAFPRKRSGLCLHVHRIGCDVPARHPDLGMELCADQKIWCLLGADQCQVNGIRTKYWGPGESFVRAFDDGITSFFHEDDRAQRWPSDRIKSGENFT